MEEKVWTYGAALGSCAAILKLCFRVEVWGSSLRGDLNVKKSKFEFAGRERKKEEEEERESKRPLNHAFT